MEKDTLMKILKEHSMTFSKNEIHRIINEEIEKSPDEMDTELIELCLDALEKADEENKRADKQKTKDKKLNLRRLLLIAAVISAILAVAIPTGAKFISVNASQEFVTYDNDHFRVDLNNNIDRAEIIMDITGTLKEKGIENPVLPKAVINDEYVKYNINSLNNETNFYILDTKSEMSGTVLICNFNNNIYDFIAGKGILNGQYINTEQVTINGIDAIVFENDDYSCIYYTHNNYEYTITLNDCDFKTAKEIANTIGG